MTNTKISLKEAYDNRDVIAQIVDLRTEAGEATDASANAVATSNHAATLAGNAVDTANAASAVANGIDAKATQALEKSAEAVTASHKAEGTADAASAVADAAAATANGIDGKAQQALDTAGDAMLEASDASAKALAVDKKVDASNVRIGALEQTEGQHDAKISTLQRDLNNVKAEYLDKFDLTGTQLIRSKTDFETEPLIRTVSPGDVDRDDGRHAVNYATMKRDVMMLAGKQVVEGDKDFRGALTTSTRSVYSRNIVMNAYDAMVTFSGLISPRTYYNQNEPYISVNCSIIGYQAYMGATFASVDVSLSGVYIAPQAMRGTNAVNVTLTSGVGSIIRYQAFQGSLALEKADVKNLMVIDGNVFIGSASLKTFIIRTGTKVAEMTGDAFAGSGITPDAGDIYVPDALVDEYKQATNWLIYASRIRPVSTAPTEASV